MAAKRKTAPVAAPVPVAEAQGGSGYFSAVASNIKGGVSVALGPCTAVVSTRNRAGKTAVLDSVRLALTGAHPIGPHYADICGLTADGSAPNAALTGEASKATYAVGTGKRQGEHIVAGELAALTPEQRANLLPLSALRDLLTLGTAKAREELFRRFGAGATFTTAPAGLDESQNKLWTQALVYSPANSDPAEKLAAAGEWIRKEKRRVSGLIKGLEEEKSRLAQDATAHGVVTDDVLREADELHKRALAWEQAKGVREAKDAAHARLQEGIEQFTAMPEPETPEAFAARISALPEAEATRVAQARLERVKSEEPSNDAATFSAIVQMRRLMAQGEVCLCCARPGVENAQMLVERGEDLARQADAAHSAWRGLYAQVYAEACEADTIYAGLLKRERMALERSASTFAEMQRRLQAMGEEYKRLNALVQGTAGEDPGVTSAEAKSRLDALQTAKTLRVRQGEVAASIRTNKLLQEDLKAVESVIAETSQAMLVGIQTLAEASVNKWMPKGFKAALVLENADGKPECRWEVYGTDGRAHPRGAASGAEWSALAVAVACAWSEGSPIRILLIDDADLTGFSAENVRNLLEGVSKAVSDGRLTQALVAWSRPEEIPSEGWTVVSL